MGTHRELAGETERRFAGITDAVTLSGGYGVHQDIRRIPSSFAGFQTTW